MDMWYNVVNERGLVAEEAEAESRTVLATGSGQIFVEQCRF